MLINEIFQILIQIIFIFFIFSCTSYIYNNKNILKLNITFPLDKITINLLILINLFLLFSIFNINQSLIIMVYILIFLLSFINKEFRNNLLEIYLNNTFLIIFILMFILSIDIAHELNLAWDAKFVYYFKTLVFFQNEKFDTLRNFPAADYPHLGAYIWSFFWKYPWSEYEYMGRISYLFIYLISIYSLINCLDHKNYIKNIFLILIVFSTYNYSLFSGYQDNLIFSLLTLLASFYYRFINSSNFKQKINYLYIILSIINILFWIKAESFIYSKDNLVAEAALMALSGRVTLLKGTEREKYERLFHLIEQQALSGDVRQNARTLIEGRFRDSEIRDIEFQLGGKISPARTRYRLFLGIIKKLIDKELTAKTFIEEFREFPGAVAGKLDFGIYSFCLDSLFRSIQIPEVVKRLLINEILGFPPLIRRELISNVLSHPGLTDGFKKFVGSIMDHNLAPEILIEIGLLKDLKLRRFSMEAINDLANQSELSSFS